MPQTHAETILRDIWEGRDFPVDPAWIAKKMGIDVVVAPLSQIDRVISGALIKKQGHDPVIVLNNEDSIPRQRYTCAHELGHYVKRTDEATGGNLSEYSFVDLRSNVSNGDEVFANKFAANLLMPENEVKKLHRLKLTAVEMSILFNVSDDAINIRLKNLGLK